MATVEVSRTLVKSPPELWTELQGERLKEAVGGGRVVPKEEERSLEWQADGARGTAVLEPSGWGTKVTLTAELDEEIGQLEHEVARRGLWARLRGLPPPPPPQPEPARREEIERRLEGLLDDLGSAHRKPFQAG
jgi:hypothetical protein